MFNFTTLSVYNSISTTGANKNMWVVEGKKPALRIGNTRFDKDLIDYIQFKNPTVENFAKVTFDMNKIKIAEDSEDTEITGRIFLYIGLSMNSQNSFYANDLVFKGKPFSVEFSVKKDDTASAIAARVKAIADKYQSFMAQDKILDVTVEGDNLTITATSGYQIIRTANLQKWDPAAVPVDCCSSTGAFVNVVVGVPVKYTTDAEGTITAGTKKIDGSDLADNEVAIVPGLEAFGDYNWMIHNLRLPTLRNFAYGSINAAEMPSVGQTYGQFIVRIKKERDGIAGEVVGQRATSVTTHVLYVAKPFIDTVKAELEKLGEVKTDADNKLQNPFEDASTDGDTQTGGDTTQGGN